METHVRNASNSVNITPTEAYAPTSEASLTAEEEDAIVTLIIIVVGIIVAMAVLFSMGIFIDCKHQKKDSMKKRKKLRLRMPPLAQRNRKDDVKTLASEMCPNGTCDTAFRTRDI